MLVIISFQFLSTLTFVSNQFLSIYHIHSHDHIGKLVNSFPLTQQKHDYVWVIVDKLIKSTHFIPVKMAMD